MLFDSIASTRSRPVPPLERVAVTIDEIIGLDLEAGTRDVARRLMQHGASPEFARAVLTQVLRTGAKGAYAIDAAVEVLARSLTVMSSPKRPKRGASRPLLAFVGPTGAGKTSSMVKIGRRMMEAGRTVVFASSDPSSLSAFEPVRGQNSDLDRGEVPIGLVRDPEDLRALMKHTGAVDAVLLDTPGLSPRDARHLDELARVIERLAASCTGTTLLVLPATSGPGALQLSTQAFGRFRPDACVITKLDETDEPGTTFEALVRARLPVAFLCDGQDTRHHLVRPTSEAMAELVLCGRIPKGAG